MAWPCPHWPQTVFFGGDAGEEQCSWGPPDSRARSPICRSQGSGKRHGDVEEYPSADRDRFFIGKKAPFLHYFLGPSDVRWQTLPTLKREDPIILGDKDLGSLHLTGHHYYFVLLDWPLLDCQHLHCNLNGDRL